MKTLFSKIQAPTLGLLLGAFARGVPCLGMFGRVVHGPLKLGKSVDGVWGLERFKASAWGSKSVKRSRAVGREVSSLSSGFTV